ncbi:c-type cytochrome [Sulfurovum sp.]|jgi:cytochrome c553|uniref:c-type cytochrome n=1 Tax=Sulfurovum sp. TaxID=1969726 RepID=UPI002A35F37F|nr:c-type cytochrome [Sulfurovum sp.]MDY0401817.1 c-type cytochrome [Sulfurovum sp.]
MKKLAISMLLAGATSLMAADGAAIYAKCVACHGANGEKSALNKSGIIKGQDAATTVEQLKGYKAGTLNKYSMGGLMKGQVAALSDEDIQAVAEHIAGL